MDKFKEIRPVVLGITIKDNKILVGENTNSKENKVFYRCLGGGIEFLEKSEDALKREFKEELDIDITVKDFIGISDNIFSYNGKNAHELILFYSIDIKDEDYKEEYIVNENGKKTKAKWINVNEFKNGNLILYPEEIFKYI